MKPAKTPAPVVALYRYAHKRDGRRTGGITYRVAASDWTPENKHTYDVTLFRGNATSCTCPARGKCKHKEAMESNEQARRDNAPLNGNAPFSLLNKRAS